MDIDHSPSCISCSTFATKVSISFNDGNKRTGSLTVTYYLERMGYPLPKAFAVEDDAVLPS